MLAPMEIRALCGDRPLSLAVLRLALRENAKERLQGAEERGIILAQQIDNTTKETRIMPYDDIEQLEPGREADLLAQDALVRLVNYRPGVITEHFSTSDHCALRTLERFPRWQANRWETGYVVYLSQGKAVGTTGNGSTLAMAATRAILRLAGRVGH